MQPAAIDERGDIQQVNAVALRTADRPDLLLCEREGGDLGRTWSIWPR